MIKWAKDDPLIGLAFWISPWRKSAPILKGTLNPPEVLREASAEGKSPHEEGVVKLQTHSSSDTQSSCLEKRVKSEVARPLIWHIKGHRPIPGTEGTTPCQAQMVLR